MGALLRRERSGTFVCTMPVGQSWQGARKIDSKKKLVGQKKLRGRWQLAGSRCTADLEIAGGSAWRSRGHVWSWRTGIWVTLDHQAM